MAEEMMTKAAAMPNRAKLTKAQLRELAAMASRDYRSHYASNFKPIQRLFELGLVDRERALRWGAASTYAITEAGRAALAQHDPLPETKGIAAA